MASLSINVAVKFHVAAKFYSFCIAGFGLTHLRAGTWLWRRLGSSVCECCGHLWEASPDSAARGIIQSPTQGAKFSRA